MTLSRTLSNDCVYLKAQSNFSRSVLGLFLQEGGGAARKFTYILSRVG
jgi:hypothetical protein